MCLLRSQASFLGWSVRGTRSVVGLLYSENCANNQAPGSLSPTLHRRSATPPKDEVARVDFERCLIHRAIFLRCIGLPSIRMKNK